MWQITGILGLALAVTGGAFKLYVDKAEAEQEAMASQLRQAADNQLVLETNITSLNTQIIESEQRQQRVLNRVNELQLQNDKAQVEVASIRKKFARHNLDVLSLRKPKLIEKIINKGTSEVLNDLENITSLNP